jgi:Trk K+ transport system NAD-binding subunit
MKFVGSQLAYFLTSGTSRRNLRLLRRYLLFLLGLVVLYSILFHALMLNEGQRHSWLTGFYWTLTVMTTLGFGDITFQGDLGRGFSVLVLMSGVIFLLVVLPFTIIQFFYAPWLEAQSRNRAPRRVPDGMRGHVILTRYDPIAISLIQRLKAHGKQYVVLEPDVKQALELHDIGVTTVLGDPDDAETYRRVGADRASMVVATGDDYQNTTTAFTVREIAPDVHVVAFARALESVDILELAGASRVLRLTDMLGRSLARRALGGDVRANVIGQFGELLIAEAPVLGTPLVGRKLIDSNVREATGLTVVGLWKRGHFELPRPDTVIEATTVLLLAGSDDQLAKFAELTAIYSPPDAPVLILGGGGVGRAVAAALAEREIPYRIIEKEASRIGDASHYIHGSAADLETLERAGVREAPSAIITTNDDPTNIYLTIYCRKLRPDIQIVSRATLERSVAALHRAGADFVMSYASMGANAAFNVLEQDDVVMLAEGLDVFRYPVPPELAGVTLASTGIRAATGCSVVAVEQDGKTIINPPPDEALPPNNGELILIGSTEGEREFLSMYGSEGARSG